MRVTELLSVSMRNTAVPVAEPAQSEPNAAVRFAGVPPVKMRATTRFVRGSTRTTAPALALVAHRLPSWKATSYGVPPMTIRLRFPVVG
jgi:hypothetical protein